MRFWRPVLTSVAALFFLINPALAKNKPKAVSLDYCADQFLLALADRDQILALTEGAVSGYSFYIERAQGLTIFSATSEEVLRLDPDVVVRYWKGFKMLPLLERAHIPVVSGLYGSDSAILYENMRLIGAALDQSERAEDMILDHQTRMTEVRRKSLQIKALGKKLRVIYLTPGGITAGEGTLIYNIFKTIGLSPQSDELGIRGWKSLPLEALVQNPPDLIVGSYFDVKDVHVSNWSLSRHDRIWKMIGNIPTIMLPGRYVACHGIYSVEAAEYLQSHVADIFLKPITAQATGPE